MVFNHEQLLLSNYYYIYVNIENR